jgi:hypothetical protein
MGLTVTLVSGPRSSGTSTVIGTMIAEVFDRSPHYVRLAMVEGGVRLPTRNAALHDPRGAADAQWLCYDRERIFELLPETLAAIHKRDRYGRVVLEADSDPVLRHAYPWDQQVFVMPAPHSLGDVFRTSRQAARALQDALDDTAEFAAEVFGLTHGDSSTDDDSREERALLTKSQIKAFLASPLGDQLATQIQLQAAYHGLPESDVVLVNTALGGGRAVLTDCQRRLEQLLARIRGGKAGRQVIFCCDPTDRDDRQRGAFLTALKKGQAERSIRPP